MQEAVTAAQNFHKVLVENDRVRVLEFRGKPGDKTSMHSHPAIVAIGMHGGNVKFTAPGGESMEIELETGQAMYMDGTEHAVEVTGSNELHGILVELKTESQRHEHTDSDAGRRWSRRLVSASRLDLAANYMNSISEEGRVLLRTWYKFDSTPL